MYNTNTDCLRVPLYVCSSVCLTACCKFIDSLIYICSNFVTNWHCVYWYSANSLWSPSVLVLWSREHGGWLSACVITRPVMTPSASFYWAAWFVFSGLRRLVLLEVTSVHTSVRLFCMLCSWFTFESAPQCSVTFPMYIFLFDLYSVVPWVSERLHYSTVEC